MHADVNDAIEAIEAKVGVDGSAVTSSHDYKLSEVTSTDKAVGKTASQTLTNKTLTAPIISTGLTASGSASNDFSGSTGTFKTSTGAVTIGGGAAAISATSSGRSTAAVLTPPLSAPGCSRCSSTR